MDDLASTILDLVGSDEGAKKLKSLAGLLLGDDSREDHTDSDIKDTDLPDLDLIAMVSKLAPLLTSFNTDVEGAALLRALKPHLGKPKQQRVDEAIKIMKLMKLLPVITESGLLRGDKSDKRED